MRVKLDGSHGSVKAVDAKEKYDELFSGKAYKSWESFSRRGRKNMGLKLVEKRGERVW